MTSAIRIRCRGGPHGTRIWQSLPRHSRQYLSDRLISPRPGSHLKEELLAALGKVSRTPIREALRRLCAEGLVDFQPNRGAYVTTWEQRDIEEIFYLRMHLKKDTARSLPRGASRPGN